LATKGEILEHKELLRKLDLNKSLTHWSDFYNSNPGIQSIWTKGSFCQLLKTKRSFFGDSIANLRSGTYLTERFSERLTEWLTKKRPNNLLTFKGAKK